MSRIGRLAIKVPEGVSVRQEGRHVQVKGPRGAEEHSLPAQITVAVDGGVLTVARTSEDRKTRALHGLTRKLLANCVTGVSQGFSLTLEIIGVGYRAEPKGSNALQLSLGFSHPILYQLPPEVKAKVDKQTVLTLESTNRHVLGEVAAQIRALRPPEPYKGKGIKYSTETIRRKAGKAAGSAGTK
jgi:large subunit ribosomal protein L6